MPEYFLYQLIVPTKLFPNQELENQRFPEMQRLYEFFKSQPKDVPNLVILEIAHKGQGYIIAAFSNKSWSQKMIFNRNTKIKPTDQELDSFDPM